MGGAVAGPEVFAPGQADPLQERADVCLDGLAEVARLEARVAALKGDLVAEYDSTSAALAAPAESLRDREVRQMSVTAQVACALTVSEGSAARFWLNPPR